MGRFDEFFNSPSPGVPVPPAAQPETATAPTKPARELSESVVDRAEEDFTLIPEAPENKAGSGEDIAPPAGEAANSVRLPSSIANRPQTPLISRFSSHAIFNDMVRRDWQLAIAADPMAFDALLYIPSDASDAETDPEAGDDGEPAYTEINTNQKVLTYADPVYVSVLDCPDERIDFSASDSDGESDGSVDDVMILRIAPPLSALDPAGEQHPAVRSFVPVGSILEWTEMLSDSTEVRCWWYVHRIYTYGTASVGSLYYCIPSRNFDDLSEENSEVTP